jgi:hypothetical protein
MCCCADEGLWTFGPRTAFLTEIAATDADDAEDQSA